jgi:zinc transporter, ZIP family
MAISAAQLAVVFFAALLTALATGLGALPLLGSRSHGPGWLGRSNALAAGVMLGASFSLLLEGGERSVGRVALGGAAGAVFVGGLQLAVRRAGVPDLGALHGADARKGLLIVAVMTAHSFAEGVGVGSSFGGGATLGVVITIAIAIHNVPEGLAISLVLVPRGTSVWNAARWSVFSSLPQPLLAVPAYVFVEEFRAVLPVGLGFAAGAMIWMVATELLPEARASLPASRVFGAAAVAFAAMFAFQTALLNV